jgi:hypothetical protein
MEEGVMSCPNKRRAPSLLFTRSEFLEASLKSAASFAAGSVAPATSRGAAAERKAVVSIVKIKQVKRPFIRPKIYAWKEIRDVWGVKEV